MSADEELHAGPRPEFARLSLRHVDGPRGRGFVYVAETEGEPSLEIGTSPPFHPEFDVASERDAMRELIVRLECDGWRLEPKDLLAAVGVYGFVA